jgi:hypothetical protein
MLVSATADASLPHTTGVRTAPRGVTSSPWAGGSEATGIAPAGNVVLAASVLKK